MPSEPGRCFVRFLPVGEAGEISRIKLENAAKYK